MPSDEGPDGAAGDRATLERRQFLAAAATGTALGATGTAAADPDRIELAGRAGGWEGRAPDAIDGTTNPTLQLTPGTTYTLVWENVDGKPHNVVIEDDAGDELVQSDIVEDRGASQTVEFTATPEMAAYYCDVHPTSMRGDIATRDGTETPGSAPEPTGGAAQSIIPDGATVGLERVAAGIASPIGMETAPDGRDWSFVVSQIGLVHVLTGDGIRDEPFLDVREKLPAVGEGTWASYDERGLLGLAFHPDFDRNRKLYVRYSAPREGEYGHFARLSEFRATEDLERVDGGTERVLLDVPEPGPVHNAGAIAFGPEDGYLYVALGDGSDDNDVGEGHVEDWYDRNGGGNGQDVTENLLGSILRIDVDHRDGGKPYAIPDDNPLVGTAGLDEHYAWGFRNPWRMSFDSDGRMFVSDSGVARFEEVNLVEKGGNYGWNVREGTRCFDAANRTGSLENCPDSTPDDVRGGEPLLDPIVEYPHRDEDGAPVGITCIGGYVYEGDRISGLDDTYVLSNFSTSFEMPDGVLFAATPTDDEEGLWSLERLVVSNSTSGGVNRYVLSFGRGTDDELYVLTNKTAAPRPETGEVYRLVPDGEASTEIGPVTSRYGSGSDETPIATRQGTETGTRRGVTATSANRTAQEDRGASSLLPDDLIGYGFAATAAGLVVLYSYLLSRGTDD